VRTQLNKVETFFGSAIQVKNFGRSDRFIVEVEFDRLLEVAAWLRMEESFRMDFLEALTVYENKHRFYFSYFLCSLPHNLRLVLRTSTPVPEATERVEIKSVIGVWPHAEPFESELSPLFGINFTGSKGTEKVKKVFGKFSGYPLRKDFEWGEKVEP
jgi:NADH:ubiquinone oxidoreductase subunit C